MARQAIRSGHKIKVVDINYVQKVSPDAWVLPCGFMGSPSVSSERIPSGDEIPTAGRNLVRYLGLEKITALISDEIGGKNGLEPMLLATEPDFDIPIVDGKSDAMNLLLVSLLTLPTPADLMGRAYPRLDQILPCIAKKNGYVMVRNRVPVTLSLTKPFSLFPVVAADGVGNCMVRYLLLSLQALRMVSSRSSLQRRITR